MSTLDFHSFVKLEDYAKIHKEYIISASSQPSVGEFLKWKFPNNWEPLLPQHPILSGGPN